MAMITSGTVRAGRMIADVTRMSFRPPSRSWVWSSSMMEGGQSRRYSVTTRLQKDLPYHLVVGLPALSPTMDAGALAEWYVSEGDSFSAGDGIAKIETDKAAMDFEAQDDGFVAKILMPAGQGNDSKYR